MKSRPPVPARTAGMEAALDAVEWLLAGGPVDGRIQAGLALEVGDDVYTAEIVTRARARHVAREVGCGRIAEQLARDVVPRGRVFVLVVRRVEAGAGVSPESHLFTLRPAPAASATGCAS